MEEKDKCKEKSEHGRFKRPDLWPFNNPFGDKIEKRKDDHVDPVRDTDPTPRPGKPPKPSDDR
ncbi:MAG: hypothetical protein U1F68_14905 [Gammaproteobacteria bacterium]